MDMENSSKFNSSRVTNGSIDSHPDASMLSSSSAKENEILNVDFLEDFDSYLEDINDRLTISRMVSDSVIRGMVNAVEQEAAEKIAWKEMEIARLKETVHFYLVGSDENDSSVPPLTQCEVYSNFSDVLVEHDKIRESLGSLRNTAKEQFKTLRKEVNKIRGSSSVRRINSGSELVGLGGILQENISRKWMDVDKIFDSFKHTLDTAFKWMDDMVHLSKASVWQWQQEHEFQQDIEGMVITNCIWSLKEDYEKKLWDQNAQLCGNGSLNWPDKIKEISSLRQELDTFSKSLSLHEVGHLTLEIAEEQNNKRTDHLHRKVSGNPVSSSSLWEGNGKHENSVISCPENLDVVQLKHMPKDDLVTYFKTEMSKMKRNHDYKIHELTEELFCLKREYLKGRDSPLHLRKDKEFDMLRKKIPSFILKLDKILVENEKLPAFSNNAESLGTLKNRFDTLLSENRQLRDLLTDKKKEVSRLLSQVSDAVEKIARQSLTEDNFSKMIRSLESVVEDMRIEASISEDVYTCLHRGFMGQIRCIAEELVMEHDIVQEIYDIVLRDTASKAASTSKCDCEDSYIESSVTQGLCAHIFRETLKEVEEEHKFLTMQYTSENESRVSLEMKMLEIERALKLEVEEKERLKQEKLALETAVEEKENLVRKAEADLDRETEQFVSATQELNNLRDQIHQQLRMNLEGVEEIKVLKSNLVEAMKQIELYKVNVNELNQKLELATKDLKEINDEKKRMLLAFILEKQNTLLMVEAKDREQRKQMEMIFVLVDGLLKAIAAFESKVAESIKKSNMRLGDLNCQLSSLIEEANVLKRTELKYKQRLERRCCDLQKAEAEVDLLGDEVDALSSLLEKIFIALDHYSPVLQHYPGIIEILKLVRRELSGNISKLV